MKQIIVNDKHQFALEQRDDKIFIDSVEFSADIKKIKDNVLHILHGNKSYTAELVSLDRASKRVNLKINGKEYAVVLKDEYDKLLESLGMNHSANNTNEALKAPMPGLILDIFVKEGDQVKKGDNLIVLEAMKMENIIKSSTDQFIKSVEIKKGDKVEKNQILFTFE